MTPPKPILGTALWGWTIPFDRALELADRFYESGGRWFDTATNYPIDGQSEHYGLASQWLAEWLRARRIRDGAVIVKLGALDNVGSPESDLAPARVEGLIEQQKNLFEDNFRVASIHWDDRSDSDKIAGTIGAFRDALTNGLEIGLSGIRDPNTYAELAPDLVGRWWIQVKYNPLDQSAYARYQAFAGSGRFLAYGLNSGGYKGATAYDAKSSAVIRGVQIDSLDTIRFSEFLAGTSGSALYPTSFNQLAVLLATSTKDIAGLILGPSSLEQLDDSISLLERLRAGLTPIERADLATIKERISALCGRS